jgi:hypothetical protein
MIVALLRASTVQVTANEEPHNTSTAVSSTTSQGMSTWQTVILDPFDGSFAPTYPLAREVQNTGSAPYGWGRVSAGTAFDDTLWCVGGGSGGPLDPAVDTYPPNVTTTVVYGPLNLAAALQVELQFAHWISVASGDGLSWGYSTDGSTFDYATITPAVSGEWETTTIRSADNASLAALAGEMHAYIAFRFTSNGDGQVGRGVFLDNVRIRQRRDIKVFFPTLFEEHFEGYVDHFDDPSSGWPEWRKLTYNSLLAYGAAADTPAWRDYSLNSVAEDHLGGYKVDDVDASTVYRIRIVDDGDEVFLTGPVETPKNFVYEIWGRRLEWYDERWANEYGVLLAKDPINPQDAHTFDAYVFLAQINPGNYSKIAIKKWERNNWKNDVENIQNYDASYDSKISSSPRVWNIFRIEREGDTLRFKVKRDGASGWTLVREHTDPSLPDHLYVGLFGAHERIYSYKIDFQFDNASIQAFP